MDGWKAGLSGKCMIYDSKVGLHDSDYVWELAFRGHQWVSVLIYVVAGPPWYRVIESYPPGNTRLYIMLHLGI